MKLTRTLLAATAALALAGTASADIPGMTLSGDYSVTSGTHTVTGLITIISGGEFDVSPGVTLQFDDDAGFVVAGGQLTIGSTAGSQVVLERSNANNAWKGVRITSGTLALQNVEIDGASNTYGGGLFITGGTQNLDEVVITNCSGTYGGGAHIYGDAVTFNNCSFIDNTASGPGGGLHVYWGADVTLNDCLIEGNTGGTGGDSYAGGITSRFSDLTMNGCIVANNYGYNGGIWFGGDDYDPDLVMDHCTVYGNEASSAYGGAGLHVYDEGDAEISNSIFWNNDGNYEIRTWSAPYTTVTYSCVEGGYTGTGNISSDPRLAAISTLEFVLDSPSPCIDAGDPSDADDADGTDPDMGAVYRPQASLSGYISGTFNGSTLYRVTGDVEVDEYTSLSISGHVDIVFDADVYLWVSGTLNVQGTTEDTVHFDIGTASEWESIIFEGATGASSISYAAIRHGNSNATDYDRGYLGEEGGGVFISDSEVDFSHCVFEYNSADEAGGALCAWTDADVDIDNCRFRFNESHGGRAGGAIALLDDIVAVTITNTDISFNDCSDIGIGCDAGAGITINTIADDAVLVDNCTIAYNTGNPLDLNQAGIYSNGDDDTFIDCIIWGNTPRQVDGGIYSITYSDVQGDPSPYGRDPMFADVSGYDLHLTASSHDSLINGSSTNSYLGAYAYTAKLARNVASNGLPTAMSLSQNAPNPFNPSTTIQFALPSDGHVKLAVYNLSGQVVAELANTELHAGYHEVVWNGMDANGRAAASGIYIYRLVSEQGAVAKRMTLVR